MNNPRIRRVFSALQRRLLRALQLGVVCEVDTEVGLGSRISGWVVYQSSLLLNKDIDISSAFDAIE